MQLHNSPSSSTLPLQLRKSRKKERACDACRRRKTKCDGPWARDNICTNCIQTHKSCTYVEVSKPRGPPKAYITSLEDKLEKLEAMLKQLRPNVDFSDHLGPPVIRGSWKTAEKGLKSNTSRKDIRTLAPSNQAGNVLNPTPLISPVSPNQMIAKKCTSEMNVLPIVRTTHLMFDITSRNRHMEYRNTHGPDENSSSEDSSLMSDTDDMLDSSVGGRTKPPLSATNSIPGEETPARFHGRSSAAGLIEATRKFKCMHMQQNMVHTMSKPLKGASSSSLSSTRRQEFWRSPRWELVYEGYHIDSPDVLPSIIRQFPPDDLAQSLINLYFLHINSYFPLLHSQTFLRQWKEMLHHHDIWFACVCVSIFAVASRWSNDPRILPEGAISETGEKNWKKAGFQYFEIGVKIHRTRRSLFYPATLFEIQTFTLLSMFLRGTESFPAAAIFVSVGLRKAQDIGAHRKKIYRDRPNADDELWKRAFWHLVVFDRIGNASLGRPGGLAEEDFDLDLPLEVDDEYWEIEDHALRFKQPDGKPSNITAFNQFIKLTQITAFTMRTVYAIDKSKVFLGTASAADWQEEVMKQLNLAMAEWPEEVPDHLKWSPDLGDTLFANQSATIYTLYHWNEMLIYRPFITARSSSPMEKAPQYHEDSIAAPLSLHAFETCVNAARACARIFENRMQYELSNTPNLLNVAQVSAALLIFIAWNLKVQRTSEQGDPTWLKVKEPSVTKRIDVLLRDTHICLNVLELGKAKWEFVAPVLEKIIESMPTNDDDDGDVAQTASKSFTEKLDTFTRNGSCRPKDFTSQQIALPQLSHVNLKNTPHISSYPGRRESTGKVLSQEYNPLPTGQLQPPSYDGPQQSLLADSCQVSFSPNSTRMRANSAASLPTTSLAKSSVPYTNNSMRRTSYPNVIAMDKGMHPETPQGMGGNIPFDSLSKDGVMVNDHVSKMHTGYGYGYSGDRLLCTENLPLFHHTQNHCGESKAMQGLGVDEGGIYDTELRLKSWEPNR